MEPALIGIIVLLALLNAYERRQHRAEVADMLEGWAQSSKEDAERHQAERRELASRIQRPDILPQPRRTGPKRERPSDTGALARVGTVAPPQPKDAA